ncbi:MAG: hypothetical protein HOD92_15475 [Deltaproteobacteria bacterium]|jgi:hypothetical protein|nr:hypothetical protein [Deltaproteobacteria bacterium]
MKQIYRLNSFIGLLLILFIGGLSSLAYAERIHLKIALLPDGKHKYFHELLDFAVKAAGHIPVIERAGYMPQNEIWKELLSGGITVHWFLQTPKRDSQLVPIRVPITGGLIGQRILLIPKGQQSTFNRVNSLKDFINLGKKAALGKMWFDVDVWRLNGLPVTTQDGDWRQIYHKVADSVTGFDYFPRGTNEIIEEAMLHPELEIERKLILVYDRDFIFYLSKDHARYQKILEESLEKIKDSGIMDNLIRKYWDAALSILRYDERTIIKLNTPVN